MKGAKLWAVPLALLLVGAAMASHSPNLMSSPVSFHVQLLPIPATFKSPVSAADPGDDSGRLFVVEKRGVIKIVFDGVPSVHPFLDIRDLVRSTGAEQGLLSLAFHPRFPDSGQVFVAYTDEDDHLVIARYELSPRDQNRADPKSREAILTIGKRYPDHNGGLLRFGPDGHLYVGVGDGGVGAELEGNAQRVDTLLGKLLRLDVDHVPSGETYGVPPDNPFVGVEGARPEIWAMGLRNPWRFSFDWVAGDVLIADVGFGGPEEINVQTAGQGGFNYGWNVFEGPLCRRPDNGEVCDDRGMTAPVWSYEHLENGCAVVGGHVYRGIAIPDLAGAYLYADHCTGQIWSMRQVNGTWRVLRFLDTELLITSFAEDAQGELYVLDLNGAVVRLAPGTSVTGERVMA